VEPLCGAQDDVGGNAAGLERQKGQQGKQRDLEDPNPPDADPRRIPYRITQNGSREFDAWLADPTSDEGSLATWVIFADMLPPAERLRLLDRMQEQLWLDNKTLVQARERVLAHGRRLGNRRYHPAAFLLLRRIKQTTADLEFLEELRRELEHAPVSPVTITSATAGPAERMGAWARTRT